jgi:(1->4)-alpha-D-glucan 1-alpha-D-glucosylmutase
MLQLYSLKSRRDWGVGDFGDLKMLTDAVGRAGGDAIGLNPLHALFPNTPENASPYSPCSRLFRNPLYLDIPAIADFAECPEAQERANSEQHRLAIANAAEQELVNYTAVVMLKLPVLELLYRSFVAHHLGKNDERARDFQAYIAEKGDALAGIAEFYTFVEEFGTQDWSQWPDDERFRNLDAIARLRQERADRIGFQCYLQWLCELQFRDAAEHAKAAGLAVGLYNDLAVSVDASSADHWTHQSSFARGVRVGAPPDPFNEKGQDWGIVPLNPLVMRETAYAYFRKLLSANMRHAGALRIDHVMGLTRLFLIPPGSTAASGAYVRYPLTELLAVVALESQRNKCMVIGEDLGTVPAGFRERLGDAGILSSRVLYFERTEAGFMPPEDYPRLAAVSVSTHDLATLSGFWAGDDLKAKEKLGLFKDEKEEVNAKETRAEDRHHLLASLEKRSLLPEDMSSEKTDMLWSAKLTSAVHAYLGQAPSTLFMVQLDDLVGQVHQANLPGSIFEYPNWRRRLTRPLEDLLEDTSFTGAMNALGKARS